MVKDCSDKQFSIDILHYSWTINIRTYRIALSIWSKICWVPRDRSNCIYISYITTLHSMGKYGTYYTLPLHDWCDRSYNFEIHSFFNLSSNNIFDSKPPTEQQSLSSSWPSVSNSKDHITKKRHQTGPYIQSIYCCTWDLKTCLLALVKLTARYKVGFLEL